MTRPKQIGKNKKKIYSQQRERESAKLIPKIYILFSSSHFLLTLAATAHILASLPQPSAHCNSSSFISQTVEFAVSSLMLRDHCSVLRDHPSFPAMRVEMFLAERRSFPEERPWFSTLTSKLHRSGFFPSDPCFHFFFLCSSPLFCIFSLLPSLFPFFFLSESDPTT